MSKLRNTHNKYKRCKNDGITYRGPIGVCTRTTPSASFSIHIPGTTWNLNWPEQLWGRHYCTEVHLCKALIFGNLRVSYPKKGAHCPIPGNFFWDFLPRWDGEIPSPT